MSIAQLALGGLVLLPLFGAAITPLLQRLQRRSFGLMIALLVVIATIPPTLEVAGGDVVELALGGYEAPLGIMLRADGLSIVFLLLTAVVGALVSLYATALPSGTGTHLITGHDGALRWRVGNPGFWPLWLGCWSGLNAVFVAGDLFNTYVGLEVVGLTGVGLVALGGRDAWAAALRYLFVAMLGSLLFLVAIGLTVSVTGTLDIQQSAEMFAADPGTHATLLVVLVLSAIGLALKLALVPMHRWLIPAHSGAPATVSPLLSALVIKASLFVLLRVWIWMAGPALSPVLAGDVSATAPVGRSLAVLAWTFAILGTTAIIAGSVMAIRQTRLKPLIAYSTVAQVGYWFLLLPILMDPDSASLTGLGVAEAAPDAVIGAAVGGTVALALGHGLAKAGLFLAAGYLKELYGTDELEALRGAGPIHPMLVLGMGCSAVGLAGIPISLGFTGKWDLATAAVGSANYWILPVVAIGTLLSVAYLLKAISPLLVAAEDDDSGVASPEQAMPSAPVLPQVPPFVLGVLTILTGFLGAALGAVLEVGAPW
ncbi:MAG: proton-conducting transporter membrane subunit [Brachybacterium sp.]|nr:proton-conducting transporter membrane subunit [Brachybacterium sp.]